ncbi:uncharacterized protein UTRI_06250_B [Ustilago trichophora]|uniref:Uncharacterized protein n=1 Tax=Ustilago trichophora TaxID=86804 RepID=A0A5C3EJW5_9BASI|nr:uncharacterized protein UTRI_06250_B [Ustilago trichophora]
MHFQTPYFYTATLSLLLSVFTLLPASVEGANMPYFIDPLNIEHQNAGNLNNLDDNFATSLVNMGVRDPIITRVNGMPLTGQALTHEIRSSKSLPRFVNLGPGNYGPESLGVAMHIRPETIAEVGGRKTFAIMSLVPPSGHGPGGHLSTMWYHHFVEVEGDPNLSNRMSGIWEEERGAPDFATNIRGRKVLPASHLMPELNRIVRLAHQGA